MGVSESAKERRSGERLWVPEEPKIEEYQIRGIYNLYDGNEPVEATRTYQAKSKTEAMDLAEEDGLLGANEIKKLNQNE